MSDTTSDIPARVAVLEQIARDTRDNLAEMRSEMRQGFAEMRTEMREMRTEFQTEMRGMRSDMRSDFRWLLGVVIGWGAALLGVMAHGFHWL
jgi:hypothetical protein